MKLVIHESTSNEIDEPESLEKFEKAVRAARRELYKAVGKTDGTVYALDELTEMVRKSYERRLNKLSKELVKAVREAHE